MRCAGVARCSFCNNQALKNLSPPAVHHHAVRAAAAADIAAHDKFSGSLDKLQLIVAAGRGV